MADEPTLHGAANRIRETAKWLTLSLAALGGVLVAGSQLSDLGALEPGSVRFGITVAGAVLAAAGAAVILWQTTKAMATSVVTLSALASATPPAGTEQVVHDPMLLGFHAGAGALSSAYSTALQESEATYATYTAAPSDANRSAAELADIKATHLGDTVQALLEVASYEHVSATWRAARTAIVAGALLAGLGVGMFAWGANPPPDVVASVATPLVLTSPEPKSLRFTGEGRAALRAALGSQCPTDAPLAVLVLGTTAAGPDVLAPESTGCRRTRFVVVPGWGSVH